jgi:hypothetical protein
MRMLDFVHLRKWTKRFVRHTNAKRDFLHGRMNPPMCKKSPQSVWGDCGVATPQNLPWWGVCVFRLRRKTHTPHTEGVGGEAASEQAVTDMRDTRALLLHSKKWTKSRHEVKR